MAALIAAASASADISITIAGVPVTFVLDSSKVAIVLRYRVLRLATTPLVSEDDNVCLAQIAVETVGVWRLVFTVLRMTVLLEAWLHDCCMVSRQALVGPDTSGQAHMPRWGRASGHGCGANS